VIGPFTILPESVFFSNAILAQSGLISSSGMVIGFLLLFLFTRPSLASPKFSILGSCEVYDMRDESAA